MNSAFMFYTEQTAKLTQIANKQTMFLINLLFYAEFQKETKQYVVDLSPARKIDILNKINSKGNNTTSIANQYLSRISKAGIMKSLGKGRWLINPEGFSGYKYVPKKFREQNTKIYETRVFTDKGVEIEAYLVNEEGEKIQL